MATKTLKWATHADLAIKKTPTVDREEFLDHMTFASNERPLFTEIFGPIVGLKEEWEEQGATPGELDFSAFNYQCEARARVPAMTGRMGGSKPRVLEETESYVLSLDELGRTMKLFKGVATLPLPLDYPVKTMEDWLEIKPQYTFSEERFAEGWEAKAREHREAGRVVCVGIPGGFDEPRQLMGEEELCVAYYEQPELVHDILNTIGDTAIQVLERVVSTVEVDLLSVHEDMAGKSGCLIGPNQIEQFVKPYYRRVWDMVQSHGARVFDLDTDGDVNTVIPALIDAGVNCMHPMEPASNMDIVEVRKQYGDQLAFYGGIDKHVIRRTKEEILTELEYKIPPMIESGGCVLALDHRIPNGTPLENYKFYVEQVWRLIKA
jgi:uroporphyrinogen-III decarboxylase